MEGERRKRGGRDERIGEEEGERRVEEGERKEIHKSEVVFNLKVSCVPPQVIRVRQRVSQHQFQMSFTEHRRCECR